MLNDDQIAAGQARLTNAGALTTGDQSELLAAFRLWLSSRSSEYTGMAGAIASARSPVAERLAGALILLKGMGFSTSSLTGTGTGVASSKEDKRSLIIRWAFGLLYELPSDAALVLLPGSMGVDTEAIW